MAEIGIFVGTMYGNSLLVAEEAETILNEMGHQARVFEDPLVADWEKLGFRAGQVRILTEDYLLKPGPRAAQSAARIAAAISGQP